MKEYGKTFTGITDADGFIILDVPFTATVIGATSPSGRSPQNLVCNKQNRMMRAIDNIVYIDLYGIRLMISNGTDIELNTTAITSSIISPYKNNLISVEIGGGVTIIEDGAFRECYALTSLTIPDNVTSIGEQAFARCTGLTYIELTDSITSIGMEAFYDTAITSIHIPSGITELNAYLFRDCDEITGITIPGNIKIINNGAFVNCRNLETVILENGVEKIGGDVGNGVFQYCNKLKYITLPSSLTYIKSSVFGSCGALTLITYEGTSTDWHNINLESGWKSDIPQTCVVHCEGDNVDIPISQA